jgi:hypothetical protein
VVSKRPWLLPLLVGLIGTFLLAKNGMLTQAFTDYETEAEPSFNALRAGDIGTFLQAAPAYGGSLILRAPFVYASDVLGGGSLAAFRAAAIPCLLAGLVFGVHLFGRVKGPGAWIVLALVTLNPITLRALEIGHPEELLGAVLCVSAVICALADKPVWAGLLLGLAFANKAWAILAIGPLLIALEQGRIRALAAAGAVAAAVLAPLWIGGGAAHNSGVAAIATNTGQIFQPWQIWWFFGSHGETVIGTFGPKIDYRAAPDWINGIVRPLIVLTVIPLSALMWKLNPRRQDALGLLALLLCLRCLLDAWDAVYYQLPLVLTLLTWEVYSRHRVPLATLMTTLLVWISFEIAPDHVSPDLQSLSYMAWILPLTILLAIRVFAPTRFAYWQTAISNRLVTPAMQLGRSAQAASRRRRAAPG